jgi:hypothetical protein
MPLFNYPEFGMGRCAFVTGSHMAHVQVQFPEIAVIDPARIHGGNADRRCNRCVSALP